MMPSGHQGRCGSDSAYRDPCGAEKIAKKNTSQLFVAVTTHLAHGQVPERAVAGLALGRR